MDIDPREYKEKPRKIGTLRGKDVKHIRLRGGLHILAKDGDEPLAIGPHVAVAMALAMRAEPDLIWTELNKSEYVDPETMAFLLPKYEALSQALRERCRGI